MESEIPRGILCDVENRQAPHIQSGGRTEIFNPKDETAVLFTEHPRFHIVLYSKSSSF